MAYAKVSDVQVRWGRQLTPEDTAMVTQRLEDVERMLKRRIPDLDSRVAADPQGYGVDVVQVEADAVLRLARNPEGYQSETDGNYTYMLQSDQESGSLSILPEEWRILGITGKSMGILVPRPVMPS